MRSRCGCAERKILLVGGAGYIGSVLTSDLLKHGYQVRCLDLLIYGQHGSVTHYLGDPLYEFLFGDYADMATIHAALESVTDVVILGGLVGDPITAKYPREAEKINLHGIRNVINCLHGKGLNKLIFVSTCSNYGLIHENVRADENHELRPLSSYARAKVEIEHELLSLKGKTDCHPTILRFATAFGLSPRMRFDLTVSEFTREMFLNRALLVFDAHTWRPYCHVLDFATAIRRVLEAPLDRVDFEVFNTGCDLNTLTKQMIVDTILRHLPDAPVRYEADGGDPRNYRVSFTKIRETLHFEPQRTVEDGVRELISALKQRVFDGVDDQRKLFGNYQIRYE